MIFTVLFFALLVYGTQAKPGDEMAYYWLDYNTTESFAVLVVPEFDKNWALCLYYDSDTEADAAFPGRLPTDCDLAESKENENNAFVVIQANYDNDDKILQLDVYRVLIDAWFKLADRINSSNSFIFDFVLNDRVDYVLLRGYSQNRISIPTFNRQQNITIFSKSVRQVTPSLHQIRRKKINANLDSMLKNEIANNLDDSPNPKIINHKINKDISFENLDESNTTAKVYTTKLTLIEQLVKESKDILPLTAKRSVNKTSSPIPNVYGISTKSHKKMTTTDQPPTNIQTSTNPTTKLHSTTEILHTSTTKTKVEETTTHNLLNTIIDDLLGNSTKSHHSTLKLDITTVSHLKSKKEKIEEVHSTTSHPTTTQKYKNEEEKLMELLMNPRPNSQIHIIGRDLTEESDTPPELIMFELANQESPKPFVPTFIPMLGGNNATVQPGPATPCSSPCGGGPGHYPYASQQQNIFGLPNPFAGSGMGFPMGDMGGMAGGGFPMSGGFPGR